MTHKPTKATRPKVPKKARPGDLRVEDPDEHPSWRFEYFDASFPKKGGGKAIKAKEFQEIRETLSHCEGYPCSQMFHGSGSSKGGAVIYDADTLDRLPRKTRDRLYERNLGNLDALIRIRAGGNKRRIFAWRGNGNVFNILWWDPEHEVWSKEA